VFGKIGKYFFDTRNHSSYTQNSLIFIDNQAAYFLLIHAQGAISLHYEAKKK
jgi:hypothetical protein